MITTKAPGKLYIAGEYAVVEPGYPAIIAAVSQYLYVHITTSQSSCGSVRSSQNPDYILRWKRQEKTLMVVDSMNSYPLVIQAIHLSEQYATERGFWNRALYDLSITSELDDPETQTKFGLGSSGAVVVATIQAILSYHGVPFTPEIVYKIGALTMTKIGNNGSFGDIAASAFGGVVYYRRPSSDWLNLQLATDQLHHTIDTPWPNLVIEPLMLPEELQLMAGWTRSKADTSDLVKNVQQTLSENEKQDFYHYFLLESQAIVESLRTACLQKNAQIFQNDIRNNRNLLRDFSNHMGICIETSTLRKLCDIANDHQACAKTSGAGGGDCGICFATSNAQKNAIIDDWKKTSIYPLPLSIAPLTKGS